MAPSVLNHGFVTVALGGITVVASLAHIDVIFAVGVGRGSVQVVGVVLDTDCGQLGVFAATEVGVGSLIGSLASLVIGQTQADAHVEVVVGRQGVALFGALGPAGRALVLRFVLAGELGTQH